MNQKHPERWARVQRVGTMHVDDETSLWTLYDEDGCTLFSSEVSYGDLLERVRVWATLPMTIRGEDDNPNVVEVWCEVEGSEENGCPLSSAERMMGLLKEMNRTMASIDWAPWECDSSAIRQNVVMMGWGIGQLEERVGMLASAVSEVRAQVEGGGR